MMYTIRCTSLLDNGAGRCQQILTTMASSEHVARESFYAAAVALGGTLALALNGYLCPMHTQRDLTGVEWDGSWIAL